jgi:predicted permease
MFSPWSELRFAARRLRRAPSFSAAVVLVLALGVGATTAVFSLVNGILLEPLPFPEPGRLVRLRHTLRDAGAVTVDQSDASVLVYQNDARAFEGVAAWRFDNGILGASEPGQTAIRVRGARVTSNFFDVLGVPPALGRAFAPGEDRPGANRVVVLSHRIWQRHLHGDPKAVGRLVVVNDVPRTVVGIMPRRFAYPADHVELWLPLARDPANVRRFDLFGIGRLKRGVAVASAQADLARVLAAGAQPHLAPQLQSLQDSIVGPVSRPLWLVFGGVVIVLLVACTNVAGLFLVRAERMQVELAVRGALGSGLPGMLALTLSESLLLSAVAGSAGVLLAAQATSLARSAGAALSLPRLEEVGVDTRVLLFASGVTLLCAVAVSVLPLLRARGVSFAEVLRGASSGRADAGRSRDALVVAQIALGVVLVAASGLMTRSLLLLNAVRPGFDSEHVVTSRLLLPFARRGAEARTSFYSALVREAKAVPGVRDVGLTDWVPLGGDHQDMALEVEAHAASASAPSANHAAATVDAGYFQTLRIPLLRGRMFGAGGARPSDEVVVARAFAGRYWPGASPLGKRVRPVGGQWHTIVGEVGDVHYDALDRPASDMVYFPIVVPSTPSLVVRTDGREADALAAIRGIVRTLDSSIPTFDEGSLRQLVENSSARARALVVLLAIASGVTSLLAAVGLYGIMAYAVSLRRRELGIRMALGARPRDVSRMMALAGLRLAGVGIVVGVASSLLTSRLLRGLLYGVSPTDPVTLGVTSLAVFVVAFVATWIPARQAAVLHPSEALRAQ